ncbi:hypothetical protein [Aquimarina sp. 2201CG5-10]|nr:hypothetical protein [Aquimarina sp. 2201CG5-10]MDY8136097.1 hypothetical protein [Aquimarina sp. 2201CG5-10]
MSNKTTANGNTKKNEKIEVNRLGESDLECNALPKTSERLAKAYSINF